jgi:hypothetical protein
MRLEQEVMAGARMCPVGRVLIDVLLRQRKNQPCPLISVVSNPCVHVVLPLMHRQETNEAEKNLP